MISFKFSKEFVHKSSYVFLKHARYSSSSSELSKSTEKTDTKLVPSQFSKVVKCVGSAVKKVVPKFLVDAVCAYRYGTQALLTDVRAYCDISYKIQKSRIENPENRRVPFSLEQLTLFHQIPRHVIKLVPLLIIAAIPFTGIAALCIAFYFPRRLLTEHYWSEQQRIEYPILYHKEKLHYYKPVLRHLQSFLEDIKGHALHDSLATLLDSVNNGEQADTSLVIKCLPLFISTPLTLKYLRSSHLRDLARIHGIHYVLKRNRLFNTAEYIRVTDITINRQGGLDKLNTDQIRQVCLLRGFNPNNASEEDIRLWYDKWLTVSGYVTSASYSLLLHSPIFLSYNHPSNLAFLNTQK